MKQATQEEQQPGKLDDGRRDEIRQERAALEEAFADMNREQRLIALRRLAQIHIELQHDLKARDTELTNEEREVERQREQGETVNQYVAPGGELVTANVSKVAGYANPAPPPSAG